MSTEPSGLEHISSALDVFCAIDFMFDLMYSHLNSHPFTWERMELAKDKDTVLAVLPLRSRKESEILAESREVSVSFRMEPNVLWL